MKKMMNRHIWKCLAWAAVMIFSSLSAETPPAKTGWEKYQVVVDRNIFMRDRSAAKSAGTEAKTPAESKAVSSSSVLTGILQRGGDIIAFFENPETKKTARIRPGEEIEGGKIISATRDEAVYEKDGQRTNITIGSDLTGAKVAGMNKAATAAVEGGKDAKGAVSADPIEQRMRERRRQEGAD
jgi:hypothetical protein